MVNWLHRGSLICFSHMSLFLTVFTLFLCQESQIYLQQLERSINRNQKCLLSTRHILVQRLTSLTFMLKVKINNKIHFRQSFFIFIRNITNTFVFGCVFVPLPACVFSHSVSVCPHGVLQWFHTYAVFTSFCAECQQRAGAKYREYVREWSASAVFPGRRCTTWEKRKLL